jgi:Domain of unknown function (DUF1707)
MSEERPPIRIGNAERTAAMKALDEHLAAGRLEIEEYGERSARAANAVTAPELAALFDDLPAPHPELPGVTPPLPVVAPPSALPARPEPSGMQVWAPRLVALSPIIAIALFLLTRQWVFFLLIPAMGAVFGSRHRGHDHPDRNG